MYRAYSVLFVLCLLSSPAWAATRATLQAGSGEEIGTAANPVKVSVSGVVSAGDATFSSINSTKIGNSSAADATFNSVKVNTNLVVTTSVTTPNTVTAGSRTGALPLFVGGVQGSPNKLFLTTTTVANGATVSGSSTVTGLTSAAKCIGSISNYPTVPTVYVTTVTAGTGTIQATLNANPGASGATVNVICAEV